MMKYLWISGLLLLTLAGTVGYGATWKGVPLPQTRMIDNTTFQLNGYGVRKKWFFDLYIGKLYLPEKSADAAQILSKNQPQMLELNVISDKVTRQKMLAAIEEGFDHSTRNRDALNREINAFIQALSEPIRKGDNFLFIYTPGKGTIIMKNGKTLTTIKGFDFKHALFGIWLGTPPADSKLKAALLGS